MTFVYGNIVSHLMAAPKTKVTRSLLYIVKCIKIISDIRVTIVYNVNYVPEKLVNKDKNITPFKRFISNHMHQITYLFIIIGYALNYIL